MTSLKKGIWQIFDASIGLGVGLFCFALIVLPLVYEFNEDQQYSTAATSPYILGVPELIQAGYLPAGFSETNLFSQRYHTRIVQPAPLKFHHMIFLTGGAPLSLSAARKMAMRIGGSGGYIEGGSARGVMGGWTEPLYAFSYTC
ncbi:shufflon system plasmid conjugative transfer pilus tip adhesin PilV [Candidatus Williamhamiltonella defendens]|uniref:shufflon system plasmid conjugative transfer pilus tip adhesin PilV n=1 Tax=Candidatus Williamhamiltonella defendens TaxID=138072 RepID=UPI0015836448|nr:shufflon system plasmid conjugative transfer pilus tip adhesin PilV [Candidatus Hamiltonella defensa]